MIIINYLFVLMRDIFIRDDENECKITFFMEYFDAQTKIFYEYVYVLTLFFI